MRSYGIHIATNDRIVLMHTLNAIPSYYHGLKWCVLYFYGIIYKGDIEVFESEINDPQYGKAVNWKELMELVDNIENPYDFLLIGNEKENTSISKDMDDEIIYQSSEFVIELFDSGYYRVFSKSKTYIDEVVKRCSNYNIVAM